MGQLSHCRQLIAHIGYGRFSVADVSKCHVCAGKGGLPLSMPHGGGGGDVCVYAVQNSKVGSVLLSGVVKVFGEIISETAVGAYPIAYPTMYPTIVRTRAVVLLHTMLTFFQRDTDGAGNDSDSGGDSVFHSVRHSVGAHSREKSGSHIAFFPDQRIAQVLELIGKYIWYCEKVTPFVCMLYVCMHMYVCMYVCIHVNLYICMYEYTNVCMNMYVQICMYVCMYVSRNYRSWRPPIHLFVSWLLLLRRGGIARGPAKIYTMGFPATKMYV